MCSSGCGTWWVAQPCLAVGRMCRAGHGSALSSVWGGGPAELRVAVHRSSTGGCVHSKPGACSRHTRSPCTGSPGAHTRCPARAACRLLPRGGGQNSHHEEWKSELHGDKDTFEIAFMLANKSASFAQVGGLQVRRIAGWPTVVGHSLQGCSME
jgi:hypothetical protein